MDQILYSDFVAALHEYIRHRLRDTESAPEYIQEALRIVDARNMIFQNIGNQSTSEVDRIYALRDLLRVDTDTLETVVNTRKLESIAREIF